MTPEREAVRRALGFGAFGFAVVTGWREFKALYRWHTYIGGWLVRVLAQVAFLASLGILIGDRAISARIALGSACAASALGAMLAIPMTAAERYLGTAQLLAVSPAGLIPAVLGRAVERFVDGIIAGTMALLAVVVLVYHAPALGPRYLLLPLLPVAMSLGSCALALSVAGIALFWPDARNLLNTALFTLLLLASGVVLPASPHGVTGVLSQLLPLSHGFAGARAFVAGDTSTMLVQLGYEALVAAVWIVVAATTQRLVGVLAYRFGGLG